MVAVSADEVEIRNALNTAVIGGVDLVVSVGGTGVTPRDVTPEATRDILDREILGIAEAIRASGLSAGIVDAGLSRGLAGVSGSTLVVNPRGFALCGARWNGDAESASGTDHRAVVELGDLNPDRVSGYCDSVLARGPVGWRWCPTAAVPPRRVPVRLREQIADFGEQHDLGVARLLDLPLLA
ncbi:molybdopterin biosynthesis protein [Mycobacterium tuberculosis RGTB423]|nr:molybdopterin biosynthesis protein [Mycobacterium tuberculosis RGTB423]